MDAFLASGDLTGVLLADVDERRGQLYFAVESNEAAERLRTSLTTGGVPLSAIAIETRAPVKRQAAVNETLRDVSSPVVGGVHVSTVVGGFTLRECTAGFNVTLPSDPTGLYLVTNSHCTTAEGPVSGDSLWQSVWGAAPNVQLAVEVMDIPYRPMPISTGCPSGWNCRYVDAAVFRYTNPAQGALGRIARPLWYAYAGAPFTLVRDTADFHITGDLPETWFAAGQWLSKVGQTTGWTAGKIEHTCVVASESSLNRALLCQYVVQDYMNTPWLSDGGDSGSPVFFAYYSEDDVYGGFNWLAGILNGGTGPGATGPSQFTFGSIHKLYEELGAMKTYPGPTCNPHPLLMGCL